MAVPCHVKGASMATGLIYRPVIMMLQVLSIYSRLTMECLSIVIQSTGSIPVVCLSVFPYDLCDLSVMLLDVGIIDKSAQAISGSSSSATMMGQWLIEVDCLTVSLHNPDGRQFACHQGCTRDCQWPLKNGGNSHWLYNPTMHCSLPKMHWVSSGFPQTIFRPANHKIDVNDQ